ncbi:MAG TPA: hypothetical protein VNG32_00375 [Candidatus Dormibacteraeota bacterium]|nr:hypothetical protein [Candidatus Dormibacteraeota bacterium]
MRLIQKHKLFLYKKRASWRRLRRLLFASPAEVQLIRIMGGKVITADIFRDHHTNFPITLVLSMGPVFKTELVKREVRAGAMWIDFGNDIKRGIEVDSATFHGDVTRQYERDEYCAQYGWQLLHVPVADIYHTPNIVHDRILKFLSK